MSIIFVAERKRIIVAYLFSGSFCNGPDGPAAMATLISEEGPYKENETKADWADEII